MFFFLINILIRDNVINRMTTLSQIINTRIFQRPGGKEK